MNKRSKWLTLPLFLIALSPTLHAQEIIVLGSQDELIALLEEDRWWNGKKRGEPIEVPHKLTLAITERWRQEAPDLPVDTKKEVFFSALLPLVLHANGMVMDRRERITKADEKLSKNETLSDAEVADLQRMAILLRIAPEDEATRVTDAEGLRKYTREALHRLDVIPPGLVLGQAAYESGYGTSRFAAEGNALFGQWTFDGEGLLPGKQRKELGDHRIASFDWPFDSVRAYYLNLSTHPAYEAFRQLRAELKSTGKSLGSLDLADGLKRYSERGQAYVDTLKGIIRTNDLDMADDAEFRDEPVSFIWGAADEAAAEELRRDIAAMRKSGELSEIIERMRLD